MSEIKKYIKKLLLNQSLTTEEMTRSMQIIFKCSATPAQISSFFTLLKIKGESSDDLLTAYGVYKAHNVQYLSKKDVLGIVDLTGEHTISLSFSTALILSALDIPTMINMYSPFSQNNEKILNALNIQPLTTSGKCGRSIESTNLCIAKIDNSSKICRFLSPILQEIDFLSIYNIIALITSSVSLKYLIIKTENIAQAENIAKIMQHIGITKALLIHNSNNCNDLPITCAGKSHIIEVNNGMIRQYNFEPPEQLCGAEIKLSTRSRDAANEIKNLANGTHSVIFESILLNVITILTLIKENNYFSQSVLKIKEEINNDKLSEVLRTFTAENSLLTT